MERLTKHTKFLDDDCYEALGYGAIEQRKFFQLIKKLAQYEDAEEQGLLIRLPVAEGTPVHCIGSCGEICDDYETDCEVCGEHKVVFCTNFDRNLVENFGETVFLTEAEAEQALAKMKGE